MKNRLIEKMQSNSQKITHVADKSQKVRDFIDSSIENLDQMENELASRLGFVAGVIEALLAVLDQLAIKWLDFRSLSWQDKLRYFEELNKPK